VDKLFDIIKGPDFPTGGSVYGYEGLKEAYTKGKGKIVIRAKTEIEQLKSGKSQIVISEIPYQVSKTDLIERIANLVNEGKVQGIVDIRDESDKEGLRVVLELKKDIDSETVLKQLYKNTQLELNYSINFLVIKNGEPRLLNIKELLEVYIEHRKEVITRRTQFLLNNLRKELHILEGLLRAIANLDAIIKLIRESPSQEVAHQKLIEKYNFSSEQAKAILRLPLGKLTNLDRKLLEQEYRSKKEEAEKLQRILNVPDELLKVMKQELTELEEKLGDKRRTTIMKQQLEEVSTEELIVKEDVIITISKNNYIKRISAPFTLKKALERVQKISQELEDNDRLENVFVTNTHTTLALVSNLGKLYLLKTYTIPELSRQAKGKGLQHLISIRQEERICKIFEYEPTDTKYLIILTKKGLVKKTNFIEFQNATRGGIYIINLTEEDEVKDVAVGELEGDVFIATKNGITIRFEAQDLRELSRGAGAIKGITLEKDDEVVSVSVISKDVKYLLFISEKGIGKKTLAGKYRVQGRGGKGIYGFSTSEKIGSLAYATTLKEGQDIVLFTLKGILTVINEKDIKETSRHARGRIILRVSDDDRLVKIQTVPPILVTSE
ncbi:MAG: DNA gyrase subunit A, partial [Planctomycetota bacterium]